LTFGGFEVPNFQLFPSQNSDLNNEQLDEIKQKAQAKNTKKTTERAVRKFEKWCEKRKITVDLKTVSPTRSARAQNDATRATNKLYALQKSWDCPIYVSDFCRNSVES